MATSTWETRTTDAGQLEARQIIHEEDGRITGTPWLTANEQTVRAEMAHVSQQISDTIVARERFIRESGAVLAELEAKEAQLRDLLALAKG